MLHDIFGQHIADSRQRLLLVFPRYYLDDAADKVSSLLKPAWTAKK
jgi:uncharacterized protein YxjI